MTEKSLSIKIEETKEKIASVINNSDLPAGVIKLIIDGVSKEVNDIAVRELATDLKRIQLDKESEKAQQEPGVQAEVEVTE